MTTRLWRCATASTPSTSAGCPNRCTGIIARVRDVVAADDVMGPQRNFDRVEAGAHADRVAHVMIGGELVFECVDGGAENEVAALEDLPHGALDLRGQRVVLRTQIDEGDVNRRRHYVS